MPANIVRPGTEADWEKAKARVREEYKDIDEGSDRFYKLVTSIYKKMSHIEKARPFPRLVLLLKKAR